MSIRKAKVADASAIAQVHVESWRSTYAGMLPDEYLARLSAERQRARWEQILSLQSDNNFVYVAENDAGVVGFASGGREREGDREFTGELYAIYLVKEHQRQGYGRQMVEVVAGRLAKAGHRSMLVWVLSQNSPARAFYERLGGEFIRTGMHDLGGVECEETSYGWRLIENLTESVRS